MLGPKWLDAWGRFHEPKGTSYLCSVMSSQLPHATRQSTHTHKHTHRHTQTRTGWLLSGRCGASVGNRHDRARLAFCSGSFSPSYGMQAAYAIPSERICGSQSISLCDAAQHNLRTDAHLGFVFCTGPEGSKLLQMILCYIQSQTQAPTQCRCMDVNPCTRPHNVCTTHSHAPDDLRSSIHGM